MKGWYAGTPVGGVVWEGSAMSIPEMGGERPDRWKVECCRRSVQRKQKDVGRVARGW
jgi:hypothetical protein